jgi:hypothetical protein
MNVERLGRACLALLALILASRAQIAIAGNILENASFEVPKVPRNNFATFPTGSTLGTCGLAMPGNGMQGTPGYQTGCWRVFGGDVDVASSPYWDAKGGRQSLELNGTTGGDVLQLYVAQPNTTYQLSFWLAGDPLLAGTVSLLVVQEQFDSSGAYITGQAIGSYPFDTTGHTAGNMGYQLVTGSFTTGPNTAYVDVEFQSTTFNVSAPWWGPVIDQVTLK